MANVEITTTPLTIHNGLFEAYRNYYEEELKIEYDRTEYTEAPDKFINRRVRQIILEHTPKQRLEVYLEWEGIMGWTETVYNLAIGNIYAREML